MYILDLRGRNAVIAMQVLRSLSLSVFLRIYNSNNNTNFINKTILRLTDLLLSENPFHFIYFLKKILNTFVSIIKQL